MLAGQIVPAAPAGALGEISYRRWTSFSSDHIDARAEELIRAEFPAPLTLSDLIAASGVSGRSL